VEPAIAIRSHSGSLKDELWHSKILGPASVRTRVILAVCWIAYGLICLATALVMLIYSGMATVMFGTLLSRVADPFTLMSLFHVVYTLMVILSALCGVLGILAGLALLAGRRSGRALALLAGFLSLPRIPLGIMLGTYTLVVLLPSSVPPDAVLSAEYTSPRAALRPPRPIRSN
jgi:hypothetical protein